MSTDASVPTSHSDFPGPGLVVGWDTSYLSEIVETMSTGFAALDREWRYTYVNAEAERLTGRQRSELIGRVTWDEFPAQVGSEFETVYRRVLATGVAETFQAFYPAPLQRWLELRVSPAPDGLAVYFFDVTARREAEELLRLSDRVGEELVGARTVDDAVSSLAQLVVPLLADWATVTVLDRDDGLRAVGWWHRDPELQPALTRFSATRLDGLDHSAGVHQANQTRRPVAERSDVTARGLARLQSPVAKEALRILAPESSLVVPLLADGRVAGLLSMCRGADRPPMTDREISVAMSIGRRAGLAIHNADLYMAAQESSRELARVNRQLRATAEHERSVARALQKAMLTLLPEPDHLHLTARYLTPAEGDQVGGDWYDAVLAPGGATTLMIGDVVGHDINAAGTMGQLRNLLRGFAWDRHDDAPSDVVTRLDRAIRDLHIDTLATAVVMTIERHPGDAEGGMRTIRWSNAGHPAPVLALADGTAHLLDRTTDVLLGVDPDTARRDHLHAVPPGATLLLYTDGLVETRDDDIDAGQERLLAAVRAHHHLPPDEFIDRVLADTVGDRPGDDVAVLVARFNAEDRPRPPGAGPAHP